MSFKQVSLSGAIILLAGCVLWLGTRPVLGQFPIPEEFSYTETKPLNPVPFRRKFHVMEKKLSCPECHTKVFQMKKFSASREMTMAKLNNGQYCGACHNGTKAFATKDIQSCTKCHVKK